MNIQRDLAIGAQAEKRVITLLEHFGFKSELNTTRKKLSQYDILSKQDASTFTSEVKWDIYAQRSGNIALEIFNPKANKASGLYITQADLWFHIVEHVYVTSVKKLKKYVDTYQVHRYIECGGDQNATLLLYKSEHLLETVFERIDNLSKLDGEKVITTTLKGV